jgi:hypothetical protein
MNSGQRKVKRFLITAIGTAIRMVVIKLTSIQKKIKQDAVENQEIV